MASQSLDSGVVRCKPIAAEWFGSRAKQDESAYGADRAFVLRIEPAFAVSTLRASIAFVSAVAGTLA